MRLARARLGFAVIADGVVRGVLKSEGQRASDLAPETDSLTMATCTAQITIGSPMTSWGGEGVGIGPDHVMYLVEGGRAAWVLERIGHTTEPAEKDQATVISTWIPRGPEEILAAALLLVAVRVESNAEIGDLLRGNGSETALAMIEEEWADLGGLDDAKLLDQLQARACEAVRAKLVITAMQGSSIHGQLALLERCSMDAEVCLPSWVRVRDSEGKLQTSGQLPPEEPDAHRFTEVRI